MGFFGKLFTTKPRPPTAVEDVGRIIDRFATATSMGVDREDLGRYPAKQYQVRDRRDPRQNINAGVKHLSSLLVRYNGNLNHALAAYNAGPTAVDRYNGVPPYPETRRYIEKVRSAHAQTRRAWFGEGS